MADVRSIVLLVCCIQILNLAAYVDCQKKFGEFKYYSRLVDNECKPETKEPWSYKGENGPEFWGKIFPTCNGKEQSPIAINSRKVIHDTDLKKLKMNNYDVPIKRATIENNGNTVEVTPEDGVERNIFVQGSTYRLLQLHFHWGDESHKGSEHTLDGIQYAMELHLVHRNAKNQNAVVAVFFKEQSNRHAELQNIIREFSKVKFNNTRSELKYLNLNNLLPANPSSFYRYTGSLTTPGCDEDVTWSVLTKPLFVSKNQMYSFRSLFSVKKSDATWKCKLVNNYRPLQPLNYRKVFISE